MRVIILNEANQAIAIQTATSPVHHCTFDFRIPRDADYVFQPLLFLDVCLRDTATIWIGQRSITLPVDWSIVVTDEEGFVDIVAIRDIAPARFEAFCFNPLTNQRSRRTISAVVITGEQQHSTPRLAPGHLLLHPLGTGPKPSCILLVRDTASLSDLEIEHLI